MNIIKRCFRKLSYLYGQLYYNGKIRRLGQGSYVESPLRIYGKDISIGSHTLIQYKTWLEARPLTGAERAELIIGDGCAIGHFNEIYSTKSVIIEDKVLTADRVYISDNLHGYENPADPVIDQPIRQIGTVRIGEGSWLGTGVCVIGASIGKHCVIGANAVVTKDIPDYCVAVGVPARIVKRYNTEKGRWERTDAGGMFID